MGRGSGRRGAGRRAAAWAERLRQRFDLEHWAAFRTSFDALAELLRAVAVGERGPAPATALVLSGDVHFAYVAEALLPGQRSAVWQLVCSPLRNRVGRAVRWSEPTLRTRPARLAWRLLSRSAGVAVPAIRWRVTHGPRYEAQVATLDLVGPSARVVVETPREDGRLEPLFAADLAG